MKNVDYPFSRSLAFLSGILAGISAVFAIMILKDERNLTVHLDSAVLPIPPVFLYLLVALLVTLVSLMVKIQLYSPAKSLPDSFMPSVEETIKSFQRSLTLLYVLVLAIIVVVPLLAIWIPGLWWIICLTGFISGVDISEVVLYFSSRKRR